MTEPINAFTAILDFKTAQEEGQVNNQNLALSASTNAYRNPKWVCRYPLADVTFPESQLLLIPIDGVSGAVTGGIVTAHTHNFAGGSFSALAAPIGGLYGQDNSFGGYMTISQTLVMDTLGLFWSKTGSSPTLNNVYLEIFRENADTSLTRIWVSADVSSSIGTSFAYFETTISPGIVMQAGARYLVRMRNQSTNAMSVQVVALARTAGVSPDSGFQTGATFTNTTTYSAATAAAARAGGFLMPFLLLASKNQSVTPLSWSDDFNRATFGSDWVLKSNLSAPPVISNGKAITPLTTPGGGAGHQGSGVYIKAVTTDDCRVEANFSDAFNINLGAFPPAAVVLHANQDMTQGVALRATYSLSGATVEILSGNPSPLGTLTQRATVSITDIRDSKFSLQYNTATTTYTALRNDQPIGLTWNDSGAAATRGVLNRFGGFRLSGESILFGAFNSQSASLDNWTLKDYVA